jgi:hypothetical protein
MRDGLVPLSAKAYKSSIICDSKPQGGGIYSKATKSTTILRRSSALPTQPDFTSPKKSSHTSMAFMSA